MAIVSLMLASSLRVLVYSRVTELNLNDRLRAGILADAMASEMRTLPFDEPDGPGPIGLDGGETGSRAQFDDFDDYQFLDESPPKTVGGMTLVWAEGLTLTVEVDYVDPNDPSIKSPTRSTLKCARITVRRGTVPLAELHVIRSQAWTSVYGVKETGG